MQRNGSWVQLARPDGAHFPADLRRHGEILEDLLGPAEAAAFPLHDEVPKGNRGKLPVLS
jgi:hypothetical protein